MVMVTLRKIAPALEKVGASTEHLEKAAFELQTVLGELEQIEVKGRESVDTLLGCMMAIEAIIGEEGENG